jgi:hypothetical protein
MDISTLTVEQLKALAYDEIIHIQKSQNNLSILQAEIERRIMQNETPGSDKQ